MSKQWMRYVLRGEEDGSGSGGSAPDGGAAGTALDAASTTSAPTGSADGGKDGGKSGAEGGGKGAESGVPTWPDDWQTKLARGDEKIAKQLSRYTSPEAMAEALIAAQNRIRSGELKSALPKNAKPEELAQWRKDNGIPEAADKYDLKFESGLVIGEEDKPVIDGFLKAAHDQNYTPEQAKNAIEWYYKEQERQTEQRLQRDDQQRTETVDALNNEWGRDYRRNINMIEGLLSKFPDSVRDQLKGGRLADGTAIFNHPEILRGFAALALEANPAGTLVPSGSGDPAKSVEEEIEKIEKSMRENRTAYNKDEKMQAKYRELLVAREKLAKRAA